ncbi:hypothetical protein GCM10027601_31090 [Nocardioides ungokensis]
MVTVPDSPVSKPSPVVGVLITLAALVVAGLMAALSLWLMPFAGLALMTVGWLGLTRGVPRGLAYVEGRRTAAARAQRLGVRRPSGARGSSLTTARICLRAQAVNATPRLVLGMVS